MATSVRFLAFGVWLLGAALPRARWSASLARVAACILLGIRPPSSCAICSGPMRAASRNCLPSISSTVADPAASIAAQPLASKPALVMWLPSVSTAIRIRSSQAAPPAAPVWSAAASAPRPRGALRCCSKRSSMEKGPGLAAAAPELNLPWQVRASPSAGHGPLPSGTPNPGCVGSTNVDGWRTGQGHDQSY